MLLSSRGLKCYCEAVLSLFSAKGRAVSRQGMHLYPGSRRGESWSTAMTTGKISEKLETNFLCQTSETG